MERGERRNINLSNYIPKLGVLNKETYEQVVLNTYIFNINIPRILGPDMKGYGPFKKGDMINEEAIPKEVLDVLLYHRAVTKFSTMIERKVKKVLRDTAKKAQTPKTKTNALQLPIEIYLRIFSRGGYI